MRSRAGHRFALLRTLWIVALITLSGVARSEAPFTFTVPQSRVLVKISAPSLLPDATAPAKPNYFKLTRREPLLIVSGWLEPAQQYKGLKAFWQSESRSPAFAGSLAPVRVEMLREGAWEVVAFDVSVPGATQSNLRAERVEAGTWIDLHLSTIARSAASSTTLRAELLAVLRQVQVLQKKRQRGRRPTSGSGTFVRLAAASRRLLSGINGPQFGPALRAASLWNNRSLTIRAHDLS